jgi:saccharopine dehydrogenase (NADP+, L-glutamate forming)
MQKLLEEKWKMDPHDKDMIVMQHEFKYSKPTGENKMIVSAMACLGKNKNDTAMAMTVGLPLGIATKLLLNGNINPKGVILPIEKEIYEPILDELKTFGIEFEEKEYMIG